MSKYGKSTLGFLLKGVFYLSLIIAVIGCGMLFQFLTSDRTQTIWREGAFSTFLLLSVIGVVGAIVATYLSSKLNSSKKPNSTVDGNNKE